MISSDEFKVLSDAQDHILSVVNRIDADMARDREGYHQIVLRVGSIENKLEEIWHLVHNLPPRIQEKVHDAVEPARKESVALRQIIETKKIVAVNLEKVKKSFWNWVLVKIHLRVA